MTKREKILLGITVTATGASLCMFAFVSLAHFLKAPSNIDLPMATRLYDNTVTQLSTLDTISPSSLVQTNTTKADANNTISSEAIHEGEQNNKKHSSLSQDKISDREEAIREIVRNRDIDDDPEKVVMQVLNELGLDQNTIKTFQLKQLL